MFDGQPRSKQQIDATSGGMSGEAVKDANKVKVKNNHRDLRLLISYLEYCSCNGSINKQI